MMFLSAMRAWMESENKPGGGVRFTVLLEGEEESGSVNLERFVADHEDTLRACDVCVISDTGMLGRGNPRSPTASVVSSTSKSNSLGPDQDLHSGLWGGKVPNPINELAKILAQLWTRTGASRSRVSTTTSPTSPRGTRRVEETRREPR